MIEYPGVNTTLDSIATEIKVVKKEILEPNEDYETAQEIQAITAAIIKTEHLPENPPIFPGTEVNVPPLVQTIHLDPISIKSVKKIIARKKPSSKKSKTKLNPKKTVK